MSRQTCELALYTYMETPKAYLVGEYEDEPDAKDQKYWIAKSIIKERSEPDRTGCRVFTVPESWAIDAGLV